MFFNPALQGRVVDTANVGKEKLAMMRRRVFDRIAKWMGFAVASLALTMTTAQAAGLWLYEQGTPDVGTGNAV